MVGASPRWKRRTHRIHRTLEPTMSKITAGLAAAATAVLVTCLPVAAQADSSGTSCPGGASGFILWDVSAEPYGVDNLVDEHGNVDGWACAKPTYVVADDEGNPFQIYNFLDNKFRPQS
jgi:hypothetical protein